MARSREARARGVQASRPVSKKLDIFKYAGLHLYNILVRMVASIEGEIAYRRTAWEVRKQRNVPRAPRQLLKTSLYARNNRKYIALAGGRISIRREAIPYSGLGRNAAV